MPTSTFSLQQKLFFSNRTKFYSYLDWLWSAAELDSVPARLYNFIVYARRQSPSNSFSLKTSVYTVNLLLLLLRTTRRDNRNQNHFCLQMQRRFIHSNAQPVADDVLVEYPLKESKVRLNVRCYNTLLNSLVTEHHVDQACLILEEMIASGVAPNVSTYNILVKAYCFHSDQFKLAYDTIRRMSRSGCLPDVWTFSTLITGLSRAGRIDEAYDVLKWMVVENCHPNVFTYAPILHALCSKRRLGDAKKLFDIMVQNGCPPNVVTYNVLIDGLCKNRDFNEVELIFRESESLGWKPNEVSYNIYIHGLCKAGKVLEAYRQFNVMMENKLYPTTVTLNILLGCLCQHSKVYEARCLLDRSIGLECNFGVVGYNTVMSAFCRIGSCCNVLKLLATMFKKGIAPNARTYNIVIHSLCKVGMERKAKQIVDQGLFVSNIVTYNTLLHGFYRVGDVQEVRRLFARMTMERKIIPDLFTYTTIICSLCKEGKILKATDIFAQCIENGCVPDLVVYVALIDGLIKNGKLSKGLQQLDRMLEHGLVPNVALYDLLIRAFCRKGFCTSRKISHICLVLDKMLVKR